MRMVKNFWWPRLLPRTGPIIEASRMSIQAGGREVCIDYGNKPGMCFREYK